jgi:hypothetical protein
MHPVVSQLLLVCTKNGRLPMVKISFPFSANAAVANQVLKAIHMPAADSIILLSECICEFLNALSGAQGARDSHFLSRREKN